MLQRRKSIPSDIPLEPQRLPTILQSRIGRHTGVDSDGEISDDCDTLKKVARQVRSLPRRRSIGEVPVKMLEEFAAKQVSLLVSSCGRENFVSEATHAPDLDITSESSEDTSTQSGTGEFSTVSDSGEDQYSSPRVTRSEVDSAKGFGDNATSDPIPLVQSFRADSPDIGEAEWQTDKLVPRFSESGPRSEDASAARTLDVDTSCSSSELSHGNETSLAREFSPDVNKSTQLPVGLVPVGAAYPALLTRGGLPRLLGAPCFESQPWTGDPALEPFARQTRMAFMEKRQRAKSRGPAHHVDATSCMFCDSDTSTVPRRNENDKAFAEAAVNRYLSMQLRIRHRRDLRCAPFQV